MSLYISGKQLPRDREKAAPVPLLLSSPYLKMQHRIFTPEFEYGTLLEDVYELANPGGEEEPYYILPSGCMTMIFQLDVRASSCILCGPLSTIRRLRIPPGSTVFCVRLKAGSGDWLAGTGASLLTDRAVPLSQYLSGADKLLTSLRRGESFHERSVLLCRALAARDAGSYRPMALLQRCVKLVHESCGLLRVSELAATVGCSERYLNRIFQERIGISTKMFSEITQLQHSLYSIVTTQPKSLLNTAVAYGYFDQTHMNRSYRKFLDCTASDIRYADSRCFRADDISAAL
ncbi:MAG: AraC family transcriptional regulator [Oscillibacter sp.]|nr:AraC family transcriptional regulator [Oscillibacter sp.]